VELHQLRAFVLVADKLSFTEAARELKIVQPAVTRKIHKLEDELGAVLFIRRSNRTLLTEAGKRFLLDARRIVHYCDESLAVMRAFARGEQGCNAEL